MYRLLIVDDEEIIVNGLFEIFSGMRELELDVYKAYSGEEAIEWLNRTRVDIVLTDINMPGIDGMQLLAEIHKNWPRCRVIFLTGYSEFEYVYRAIQHPGVSYVLKTEDHEKVIETVLSAIREIRREVKTEDLIHEAKQQMDRARSLFQSDYLLHLLRGDDALSIGRPQFEQLSIPMQPEQPVLLLTARVEGIAPGLSYSERMRRLHSARLLVGQYLGAQLRNVVVMDEQQRFVWFLQPVGIADEMRAGFERAKAFLKGTLEAIQGACRESLGAYISFALSGEPVPWAAVSAKYYELSELLGFRLGAGLEMLLIDTEFEANVLRLGAQTDLARAESDAQPLEALLRQRTLDSLEVHLEAGQREKFFEVLLPFTARLSAIRSKNSNLAIEAYCRASLALLAFVNRWKLTEELAFRIGQNKLMRIDAFDTWADAAAYLTEMAGLLFDLESEGQTRRTDDAIMRIQRFIEEHLGEDLSLVRLAEQVCLNPSYLSRLYKQVTGVNLSEFIEAARIRRAKQLLEREEFRIHEVARQVGYETAASFTRFFRKAAGASPQEYRDARLSGKQRTTT